MANPYFQTITQRPQDFSMLRDAGNAWAKAYESVGSAIGKVGSAYFEKKGKEKTIDDYMLTDGFKKKYLAQGGSPADLQRMTEDEKFRKQEGKRLIDSVGGIKEFDARILETQKMDMLTEQHEQQKKLTDLNIEKADRALTELDRNTQESNAIKNIFASAFKRQEDGSVNFDFNQIKHTEEEAYLLPKVYKQMKDMNLLPKASFAQWRTSMEKQGKYDRTNPSSMRRSFTEYMGAYGDDITDEGRRGMYTTLDKDLVEPSVVMKDAKDFWQADLNYKEWQSAEGTNDRLQAGIKTAIKQTANSTKDDPAYEIANAPSAGFVVRQFARLANGVGVMTNEDVDAVKGASDARSTYERIKTQILGDGSIEREATAQDVQNGWADRVGDTVTVKVGARASAQDILMIKEATEALMKVNDRRLEQHGLATHRKLQTAYPTVDEQRLLELSPYSQYHDRAFAFEMNDNDLPDLAKTLEVEGEDFVANELRSLNPNLKENKIAEIINKANNYTTDQKVSKEVNNVIDEMYSEPPQEMDDGQTRQDLETELDTGLNKKGFGDVVEGVSATVVSKKVASAVYNKATSNLARGNTLEAMGESSGRYKEVLKEFKKAPKSKLVEYAKDMGVDTKNIKSEKELRKKLGTAFKKQMKGKVAEYLAKKGVAKSLITKIVGTVLTGGASLAIGSASFFYDIADIVEAKGKVESDELQKMLAKYPDGSEQRRIIEQMILDRNVNSGDFKEYQRKRGGGTGNSAFDYDVYKAEILGT